MGNPYDFMPAGKRPEYEKDACPTCHGLIPIGAPDKRCRWHQPPPAPTTVAAGKAPAPPTVAAGKAPALKEEARGL